MAKQKRPGLLGMAMAAAGAFVGYVLMRERMDSQAAEGAGPLLLDEVLPEYEFRGIASTVIDATPADIFRAFREVSLADMPLADALINIRYLPGRLLGKEAESDSAVRDKPIVEQLGSNLVLAEAPDQEVVVGTIGKFHNMADQQPVAIEGPGAFEMFSDPEYQKLVMSWYIAGQEAGGYRLAMENRTHALSDEARLKFVPYWWLMIKWGSHLLSHMLLGAIKRRAEAQ